MVYVCRYTIHGLSRNSLTNGLAIIPIVYNTNLKNNIWYKKAVAFIPRVAMFTSMFILLSLSASGATLYQSAIIAVYADQSTIEQSSDRFFGEGLVQIIVTDPTADNDNAIESLLVDIDARSKYASDSGSFVIPETNEGSSRFEFFLMHGEATAVDPDDIDSVNADGVEGSTAAGIHAAPIITFGSITSSPDLVTDSALYEDVHFEILAHANDVKTSVEYKKTIGTLSLDRDSYGSDNYVYVLLSDHDANLNPTLPDEIVVNYNSGPNSDLFTLDGGDIVQDITFRETGDNSGIFEGEYRLGSSIIATSESLSLTLHDKSDYNTELGSPENDSNLTDEVSFTVGNTSGRVIINDENSQQTAGKNMDPIFNIDDKNALELGEVIHLTVNDTDANIRNDSVDTIEIEYLDDSNLEQRHYFGTETGENTGIFAFNFVLLEATSTNNTVGGGVEQILVNDNITKITLHYVDKHPLDYFERIMLGDTPEKDFVKVINVRIGGIDIITVTSPTVNSSNGKVSDLRVGSELKISTALVNNLDQSQHFVIILEVRDNNDVTVFLGSSAGVLPPSGQTNIELPWTPEMEGNYEFRTFAISQFDQPLILSLISSSTIMVNQN